MWTYGGHVFIAPERINGYELSRLSSERTGRSICARQARDIYTSSSTTLSLSLVSWRETLQAAVNARICHQSNRHILTEQQRTAIHHSLYSTRRQNFQSAHRDIKIYTSTFVSPSRSKQQQALTLSAVLFQPKCAMVQRMYQHHRTQSKTNAYRIPSSYKG